MLSLLALALAIYSLASLVGALGGRRALVGVYALSALAAALSAFDAITFLVGAATAEDAILPLGLPWLGAHFHADALSAWLNTVTFDPQ